MVEYLNSIKGIRRTTEGETADVRPGETTSPVIIGVLPRWFAVVTRTRARVGVVIEFFCSPR